MMRGSDQTMANGGAGPQAAFDVEPIWFALLRHRWSSLALVPAHAGGSVLALALAISKIGALHRDSSIEVVDAAAMDLTANGRLLLDLLEQPSLRSSSGGEKGAATLGRGVLRIIALESVLTSQAGIPIALAADLALLCVELGATDHKSARRTIELVGRSNLLGCLLI